MRNRALSFLVVLSFVIVPLALLFVALPAAAEVCSGSVVFVPESETVPACKAGAVVTPLGKTSDGQYYCCGTLVATNPLTGKVVGETSDSRGTFQCSVPLSKKAGLAAKNVSALCADVPTECYTTCVAYWASVFSEAGKALPEGACHNGWPSLTKKGCDEPASRTSIISEPTRQEADIAFAPAPTSLMTAVELRLDAAPPMYFEGGSEMMSVSSSSVEKSFAMVPGPRHFPLKTYLKDYGWKRVGLNLADAGMTRWALSKGGRELIFPAAAKQGFGPLFRNLMIVDGGIVVVEALACEISHAFCAKMWRFPIKLRIGSQAAAVGYAGYQIARH